MNNKHNNTTLFINKHLGSIIRYRTAEGPTK